MIENINKRLEKLDRHLTVLEQVVEKHPIGIVNLSKATEVPHHHVRYSLRQLENQELIEPTHEGAVPTDKAKQFIENLDGQLDEVIAKFKSLQGFEQTSSPE